MFLHVTSSKVKFVVEVAIKWSALVRRSRAFAWPMLNCFHLKNARTTPKTS